jgi:class 3 adenylate cyclase
VDYRRGVSASQTCPTCGRPVPAGARFCPSCGAPQAASAGPHFVPSPPAAEPEAPSQPAERAPPPARTGTDELRPITALFADVVGSTSLGERLQPDEVKALIGECVSRMSHAVEEYGGTIQAYMGDGIAAYFGLPQAHEDDPERAARAALRILEVVGQYAHDIRDAWGISDFNVRVGINSGVVGVGMVGGARPQEVGLGDTTNVAARLQSAAEPGTIAAGEASARLLAHRFVLEPLGETAVKGREAPVPAWRLVGPRGHEEAETRTPLVGRDAELERLRDIVDELTAGRGQIASIVGEVGLGKTRLLAEIAGLAGERVTWLEGRCLSYGGELLYWPFVEMLRNWLDVTEGDAELAVRTKLRARMNVALGARAQEVLPYLARLLSVRVEPEIEQDLARVPPDVLARHVREAFRAWIEALAAARPVIIAIDDLHWADPSTRELAEDLLDVTDRAPVLVVTTFRPDPASEAWRYRLAVMGEYSHRAVEVPLGPLPAEPAARLAEAIIPGGKLDPWTLKAIVERAEGNPLYLEELLRSLIESGALERKRNWTLTISHQELLPPALETLLVARIDRLPPEARRVAQVASVVGREFPVRIVEQVAGADSLEGDLAVLLRADVIRELRRYPELEYTFKHGLLQEAALSTLPPATRRDLYAQVAAAYEELFPTEEHLPRLAHYSALSRDHPKALAYLERAAERAWGLDARAQAQELWGRALKVANRLGDGEAEERISRRLAGEP